ncbi:TlpA family protein disulfide reductase [Mangrovimonas spongiae]|uniref:Thioredoxin domain-containing protein n=1 Tax=Mangrovimonas spongiae TaxID=2494697 RepID=A0A428JVS1_9FLAO|nr:hypothetical protein [Mangrovimonas spongiae]RSK38253.1 hypothetical protein EJA19_12210 [Mangrovimonas spongiae]
MLLLLSRICVIVSFGVLLVSCEKDVNQNNDVAYLGGEIVNPKDDFVVLTKSDSKLIDTLKLDKRNRFIYKFDSLTSGLYLFKLHAADGFEHQMVLLEPNDSIMLRLNTMEFDESLVFTGHGAKKNNYLIELFLESEIDDKKVLGFSQLPPKEFEAKVDSIRESKLKKLKDFSVKNTVSKRFNDLVEANINYDYYLSKEVYPFVNYSTNERRIIESLPEDFYAFRKDIDYNHSSIKDYFPYYSFLRHHFENLALTKHFKESNDSIFNRKCLDYNLTRLDYIDSLVKSDNIKNSLLMNTAIEFISDNKNVKDYDTFLKSFNSKCSDKDQKEYLTNTINALKGLKPGNTLPNIKVFDFNGNEKRLGQLMNHKPTVIYFWRQSYLRHFQESHEKVKELEKKYPEINFVAINAYENHVPAWQEHLKLYKYDKTNEFLFENPTQGKQSLAIYPINKVILVNKKGQIINPHTNMFSIHFENQLLEALNP